MEPSLVILAAGIGSRYGGIKQLDTFGPNKETIIDYSIYDAINVGFKKVVFVIRKNIEKEFRQTFLEKFSAKIQVEYIFQELDNLPPGISLPEGRSKPWGTGHAVMVTENKVNEPFAIINADDYYGRSSFQLIYDHLYNLAPGEINACLIGFALSHTLSEHGTVSRGICALNDDQTLSHITEMTKISRHEDGKIYNSEESELIRLREDEIVSMNLMGFTPAVFPLIHKCFLSFFEGGMDELKSEFYIPNVLDNIVQQGKKVPVLTSSEEWIGVTYREDKQVAMQHFRKLVDAGNFPDKLWD